uniref:Uncharacterized protein n=1 Tax=Oryza glumipatula TaxID=40148 RepID=A0A0E0A726_9ORYZ
MGMHSPARNSPLSYLLRCLARKPNKELKEIKVVFESPEDEDENEVFHVKRSAETNEGIKLSSLSDIDQEVAAGKGEESGVGPGDTADGDVAHGCRPT